MRCQNAENILIDKFDKDKLKITQVEAALDAGLQ
jgi:hypothetical protein